MIDLTTHKLTRLYGAFSKDAFCLNTKAIAAIGNAKPTLRKITGIGLDVMCDGVVTNNIRPMVRVLTTKGEYIADKVTGALFDDKGNCMSSASLRLA